MGRPGWRCATRPVLCLWYLWWGVCCFQTASPAATAGLSTPCQVRHSSHRSPRDQELLSNTGEPRHAFNAFNAFNALTLPSPHHASSVSLRRVSGAQSSRDQERARALAEAAPDSPPPPPTDEVEILAPDRTYRKNPLQGFAFWRNGWNILDINYWASLIWSGVPAAIAGLVWLLAGLLVLTISISACICCRARRERWRNKKVQRHKAVTATLLALGGTALALCITGFVTLSVGQVGMWNQAAADMQFIVDTTEVGTTAVRKVAQFLQAAANASIGNKTLSPEDAATLSSLASSAIQTSDDAEAHVLATQSSVDHFLETLALVILIVTSVFMLLIISGIALVLWRKKWLSFVCIGFMWALCVFALAMLTITLDAYNFLGDTQAALDQVEVDPGATSAMQYLIPCTNQSTLNITGLGARKAIYSLVNLANSEWNSSAVPPIHVGNSTVSQLCNPFQGPPDYLPVTTPCHPNAANLTDLAKELNGTACAKDPEACSTVHEAVQVAALLVVVMAVVLQTLYPSLGVLVSCQSVAGLAKAILSHSAKYYDYANQAWIGYLLLSMGSMFLCLLLPFYVIRALRASQAAELTSVESEPYTGQDLTALGGAEQSMKSFTSCDQSFHDELLEGDGDGSALHPVQSAEEDAGH